MSDWHLPHREEPVMAEPDAQLAPRVLIAVGDPLLRRVASTGLRDRGF